MMVMDSTRRVETWDKGILFGLFVVHALALALPLAFPSAAGAWAFLVLTLLTTFGVTAGYHRLLTHGSYEAHPALRKVLTVLGLLAGQAPPLYWVAFHRMHHQFSDKEGDPHSPSRDGFWYSHLLWMIEKRSSLELSSLYAKYAPDLHADPFMRGLNKSYLYWHLALIGLLLGLGSLAGWYTAISLVAYGYFLRVVFVYHGTWFINSGTHRWGYRNYDDTGDTSTNLWWEALLSMGEGWHNNHHKYPWLANHGHHRWWELDGTYWLIRLFRRLGLAWNVKDTIPRSGTKTAAEGTDRPGGVVVPKEPHPRQERTPTARRVPTRTAP